jgi:putative membrane protein
MHQEHENSWEQPSRQPVAGMVLALMKAVILIVKAFWPIMVLVLIKTENEAQRGYMLYFLIIPVFIITRSIVDYFNLRFYIEGKNLILRKGVFSKKIISVPLERIHTVNLDQHFIHKLFNITSLKIDTAGSSKSEAVIDAIEMKKAEALKDYLLSEAKAVKNELREEENNIPANKEKGKIILNVELKDIFRIGITANHIQAFFVFFAFLVSFIQNLEEIFGDKVINLLRESASGLAYTTTIMCISAVTVLFISIVVSLIRTLLLYMNFYLTETARGYKMEWGFLNSREVLIPYDKIQYISWKANWVRSMLGIFMLDFHQATDNENDRRKPRMYIPLTRKDNIPVLLNRYHPAVDQEDIPSYQISKKYVIRKTLLRGFPIGMIPAVLGYFTWGPEALLFLLYIPFEYFSALVFQKKFRLYTHPEAIQVTSGVWGRETQVLKWHKLQVPAIGQSLYQKRHRLATLKLNTAGGTVTLPFIDYDLALKIYNWALYKVETHEIKNAPKTLTGAE